MEEKRTIPLPADPLNARRKRTIAIAAGAVVAVAVGVVSVVAVAGGSSPHKPAVGVAAATESSSPYATDSGGGYSQQPQFTWSARAGLPPGSPTAKPSTPATPPSSTSVAAPPPTGPVTNPAPPTSVAAPPPSTVTKVAAPPTTSAPPPPSTSKAPTTYQISGTVSCVSGHSVEGVWVQAAQGSGYSPWQGIGNGSTSRYWYTLPSTMSFSLHVGCRGTTAAWGVALTTPQAPGPVANFTCHDVSGQAEYGTCDLQ
ncbi:hypothetical protein [Catenulispora rubra]|uniref:hypothetical protein n=1 Tax=Catenulispora rubra TaxID=280293 RepID=UPI00189223E2|nr:hypothetical protein [Catenulispora rubra]